MRHLTPQQRVEIIKTFYINNRSITNTRRKLREFFGVNHLPSKSTIQRIIDNFENLYTLGDKPKSGRPLSQRTPENIDAVRQSLFLRPEISHRRRARELGMSPSCLFKILKEDLNFTTKEYQTSDGFLNENSEVENDEYEMSSDDSAKTKI